MPPLPAITAKQLIKRLELHGFVQVRQSGSHVRLRHENGRSTSVPVHAGRTIGKGLLRGILRQAGLDVEDIL